MIQVGDVVGGNEIVRMVPYVHGWVAFTEVGDRYDQRDFPEQSWPPRPRWKDYLNITWVDQRIVHRCLKCGRTWKTEGPAMRHAYNCGS